MIFIEPYFPFVLNSIFATLIVVYCLIRKNWLVGTFLLSTFYFAYTVFPQIFLSSDARYHWIQNLQPVGIQITAVVFLLIMLLALVASSSFSEIIKIFARLPILANFALIILCVSILFHFFLDTQAGMGGFAAFKGEVSTIAMFVIALGLTLATSNQWKYVNTNFSTLLFIVLISLAICAAVAFWEVSSRNAWVANNFRNNLIEYRASSVFRNPNVYGVWVAAIAMVPAFASIIRVRYIAHPIFALSAVSLFLSGSRSSLILTLIFLVLPILLAAFSRLPTRRGIEALVIFLIYFFSITLMSFISFYLFPDKVDSKLAGFGALALRWLSLPGDLINFLLGTTNNESIKTSIEGRFFIGDTADNGILVMVNNGWLGKLSAASIVIFFGSLLWAGIKRLRFSPNLCGVYALTALSYCILIGLTMQAYQLFPIWLFVSQMLSLFLMWYLNFDDPIN